MKTFFKIFILIAFLIVGFFLFKELNKKSKLKNKKQVVIGRVNQSDDYQQKTSNLINETIDNDLNKSNIEESKKEDVKQSDEIINLDTLTPNDLYLGNKDASVIMIEYDSLTCPHCKEFHDNVFEKLKNEYISTGKLLYISRDFPTDGISFRLSLMLGCAGSIEDKFKLRSLIFKNQEMIYDKFKDVNYSDTSEEGKVKTKVVADDVLNSFIRIFEMAGFDKKTMETCSDPEQSPEIRDEILERTTKAFKSPYKINAAPAFIINGKKYDGVRDFKYWKSIIDQELEIQEKSLKEKAAKELM